MKTIIFLSILITLRFAPSAPAQDLSFSLPALSGEIVKLEKHDKTKLSVVCFLGTECPLAKLYSSRLNGLASEFNNVQFVAVFSNSQDSAEDIRLFQAKHRLQFPIVKDNGNVVADQFDAERTPEVFVLDHELTILYRGRIDDQYQPGTAKPKPNREDLRIALLEILAGQRPAVAATSPEGCLIGRVKDAAHPRSNITYANQVSRLLQNHCAECHRPGQIGPMAFSEYDEVVGWAEMIVEVVDDGRMPPWHADPEHGQFLNERRMTSAEKQMLRDWVADGAPQGDLAQLPPPREFSGSTQWRLPRQPDQIVDMRSTAFQVPAAGTVEYQYFVVDPGFKEDKWVTAAEILPGNRSVLHHSIVFVRPPDGAAFRGIGWLAAYVPGQNAPTFNPKSGRRVPAGSKFVFQQHYTPIGKPTDDLTQIGLVFGDESEIENEVFTILAMDQEFMIPAGAENHEVSVRFPRLPKRGELLGVSPHMHFRGKSFELTAKLKTDIETNETENKTLLNVPKYDFNWQHNYQFQNPIPTSEIESLEFVAAFDNSPENPSNPDPSHNVTWGDQTWEEMAVAFVVVSQPRVNANVAKESFQPTAEQALILEQYAQFLDDKATAFVADYFERFDTNGDDEIRGKEYPLAIRRFGRSRTDNDKDGIVTRQEVFRNAREHFASKIPVTEFAPNFSNQ